MLCIQKPVFLLYLPSSLNLRGPYLSMMMPRGSVMALRRKEPMVKARFSISSCSLQMGQPFILRFSSSSCLGLVVVPFSLSDIFCPVLLPGGLESVRQSEHKLSNLITKPALTSVDQRGKSCCFF